MSFASLLSLCTSASVVFLKSQLQRSETLEGGDGPEQVRFLPTLPLRVPNGPDYLLFQQLAAKAQPQAHHHPRLSVQLSLRKAPYFVRCAIPEEELITFFWLLLCCCDRLRKVQNIDRTDRMLCS